LNGHQHEALAGGVTAGGVGGVDRGEGAGAGHGQGDDGARQHRPVTERDHGQGDGEVLWDTKIDLDLLRLGHGASFPGYSPGLLKTDSLPGQTQAGTFKA
jgi:hypothetical protein